MSTDIAKAAPTETFHIRPKRTSRYRFVVHIGTDTEAMRAEIDRTVGARDRKYLAMCCNVTVSDDPWMLGYVFFSRDFLSIGIVAHEMAHAALRALDRRRIGISNDTEEEEFCRVVECLNASFWCRYWAIFPNRGEA